MIPNLLWTALFLLPLAIFCYRYISLKTVYILLGLSFVPVFLPNSFFDAIQLSRSARFYKNIGVKYINAFAQNGSLINAFMKRKYPGFKVVSRNRASVRKQYYQTYFFEKFHFSLFIFFTTMTIYAGALGHYYWILTLTVCNLLFNVYPNLLQQYVRVKLRSAVAH
ncbi:MAG: hypothetical protein J0H29_04930 [Sphingobacteriales bacterium]|nr:hypothetical protein [Sphingobacteriales bacterium]OJY86229.1 MAG: hypothetical protein BGP14_17315 [Sphingobacteriales bacterium 44-15]